MNSSHPHPARKPRNPAPLCLSPGGHIKKPRNQGWFIAALTSSQKNTLFRWLVQDNLTYPLATERVARQWKIPAKESDIRRFWQNCVSPRLLTRHPAPGPAPANLAAPAALAPGAVLFEIVLQIRAPALAAMSCSPVSLPPLPQPPAPARSAKLGFISKGRRR